VEFEAHLVVKGKEATAEAARFLLLVGGAAVAMALAGHTKPLAKRRILPGFCGVNYKIYRQSALCLIVSYFLLVFASFFFLFKKKNNNFLGNFNAHFAVYSLGVN